MMNLRSLACCLLLAIFLSPASLVAQTTSFRLMSFNIWVGGVGAEQPLSQTAKVMELADIVGVQESFDKGRDNSVELARQLDRHHFQQGEGRAVISRFPITGHTPGKLGVFVEIAPDQTICLFNAHFPASPYQPYQLLAIEYNDAPFIKTEREAIDWAQRSRGAELTRMLIELSAVRDRGIPTFVTGDFNEPSHLDWTQSVADEGVHPIKVNYPTARLVAAHGLVDSYRQANPNVIQRPGFTWTPLTDPSDKADHHDRIDFVFADRRFSSVVSCEVIGEQQAFADQVVTPWPSDHRAVIATLKVRKPSVDGRGARKDQSSSAK